MIFLKMFFEKIDIEKNQQTTKKQSKSPRPNKEISVIRVTGVKILGKVGTHIFFILSFFWKKINFMHFERLKMQ